MISLKLDIKCLRNCWGGGMGEQGIVGVLFTFWQCPKAATTFQGEQESGAHGAAPAPFLSLGFLCIYFLRSFLVWSCWFCPRPHGFLPWVPDPEKPSVNSFSSPAGVDVPSSKLGVRWHPCCRGAWNSRRDAELEAVLLVGMEVRD